MILFLGNCQIGAIYSKTNVDGRGKLYVRIPSTHFVSTGEVKKEFDAFRKNGLRRGLEKNFASKVLLAQPDLRDLHPEAVFVNLFNERPVLTAKNGRYHISISENDLNKLTVSQKKWISSGYDYREQDYCSYPERFLKMLFILGKIFPDTPLVVLGRLRPLAAFGPNPRSLLHCWDEKHEEINRNLRFAVSKIRNATYISIEKIAAAFCLEHNCSFDAVTPFMRYEANSVENGGNLKAIRDIEHFSPAFSQYSATFITSFFKGGPGEFPLSHEEAQWLNTKYVPPPLDLTETDSLLQSGDAYLTAMGISRLITWKEYRPELVNGNKDVFPVQQNLLHMMRGYAELFPSWELLEWCLHHKKKARAVLADREQGYADNYVARIEEIENIIKDESDKALGIAPEHHPALAYMEGWT